MCVCEYIHIDWRDSICVYICVLTYSFSISPVDEIEKEYVSTHGEIEKEYVSTHLSLCTHIHSWVHKERCVLTYSFSIYVYSHTLSLSLCTHILFLYLQSMYMCEYIHIDWRDSICIYSHYSFSISPVVYLSPVDVYVSTHILSFSIHIHIYSLSLYSFLSLFLAWKRV